MSFCSLSAGATRGLTLEIDLKKLGVEQFSFRHLFSAEIVEFKQAYIERNFRPPLLFRDAIELHKATAYAI